MQVQAYAAMAAKAALQPWRFDLDELGPNEVDVQVTHCGICHTDVAQVDNEWGMAQYPVVPGHEIVGTVAAVGSAVDGLTVGQRVGVGALCGSCMKCEWCEGGKQHVCPQVVGTVMGTHKGGFASVVRVNNWQFAYPLPEEIAPEHAGPLMCAGTTVFTPLLRYGVRPTDRVAVVGIGGLGHLAVQYLAKWGCDVTAISSTHDKDEQAHSFGARQFIATRNTDELKKTASSFDFILSTVSADLPWDDYMQALRPQGKLCIVGIPGNPISIVSWNLIGGEKSIVGGQPGSIAETKQMLEFTARHGIKPMIETFPMQEANAALDHARQGESALSSRSRRIERLKIFMASITTLFGATTTAEEVVMDIDLTGKRAIVTGASSPKPIQYMAKVQEFSARALAAMDEMIEQRLRQAIGAGELPPNFPVSLRSRQIAGMSMALALRAVWRIA